MAVRLRKNGKMLDASKFPEKPGDSFIDDVLQKRLEAMGVLVRERRGRHERDGRFFWIDMVPEDRIVARSAAAAFDLLLDIVSFEADLED